MTYLISPPVSAILILSLDVEHVLHVKLEGLGAPGPHHAWALVHLKPAPGWKKEYGQRMQENTAWSEFVCKVESSHGLSGAVLISIIIPLAAITRL